jgi:glycosyltransferase involved in cell wall biosynthesis
MEHAEQAALSLFEANRLLAYVTSFAYREDSAVGRLAGALPGRWRERALTELGRRQVRGLPADKVATVPGWEVVRTLMQRAGVGEIAVDRIWDIGSHHFDRAVARRFVPRSGGVAAFEYTALESFRRAGELGLPRVLHVPSLENRGYLELVRRERAQFPELRRESDAHFDGLFEARQARREVELQLADLVIANSSLTKATHVSAGTSAGKIEVVPLAAPEPIAEALERPMADPLTVLWSGSFIVRTGAHLLLEAWRRLAAGPHARLQVFGRVDLPQRLLATAPDGIAFMGSVPRERMLRAYESADVLVFPTLSDGWGLCVTEALSRGVPVITTDKAGAADLIRDGQNGRIVEAGDIEALRAALQWCLDERAALNAMRPAALESARRRQWSDFRVDHRAAIDRGLARSGFGG